MANPTNPVIYLDDFARAHFWQPITDWTPVVVAALASFDHCHDDSVHCVGGVLVFGPGPGAAPLTDGLYLFQTPARTTAATPFAIEVHRTVILRGCGGGLPARTMLRFANGLGGIRFNSRGYPLNADGSQSGLLTAQGSRVEHLCVQGNNGGARTTAPNAHGIYANCGVGLYGVTIHGFSGHGVYLHGNPGDVPGTGCDFSRLDGCWSVFNLGNGCHIEGHDANGCLMMQSSFTQNAGYGVYDNSLTGAVILGCQFEAQATGIWANQGSATTTCLGVYKESHGTGGGEQVTMNGNAVVVGNVLASDLLFSPGVFTSDSTGGVSTVLGGRGQMSRVSVESQDGTGVVGLGSGTKNSPSVLALSDRRENNGVWPFTFKGRASGGVYVDWASTNYPLFGFINSRCTKANGFPCNAASIPDFNNGGVDVGCHLTGDVNHKIFIGVANAKPASTAYPVGSVMHNNAACNAGDPSLWKLVNRAGALQWVVGATLQG